MSVAHHWLLPMACNVQPMRICCYNGSDSA